VTLHQLSLHGSKKRRTLVDEAIIDRFLVRDATLAQALLLEQRDIEELRAHARALTEAGRWEQALEAFGGLAALGELHHLDPVYWGLCHRGLGDEEKAEACFAIGHEICARIEAELAEASR
jgi:hypothetical protein